MAASTSQKLNNLSQALISAQARGELDRIERLRDRIRQVLQARDKRIGDVGGWQSC